MCLDSMVLHKSRAWHSVFVTPELGREGRDRGILGVIWPANLAETVSFRFFERLILKKITWKGPKVDINVGFNECTPKTVVYMHEYIQNSFLKRTEGTNGQRKEGRKEGKEEGKEEGRVNVLFYFLSRKLVFNRDIILSIFNYSPKIQD